MSGRQQPSRILIIGSGGAGKSTLARELSKRLRLPLVPLDALYWRAGWDPTPSPEWESCVRELVAREFWVMDGNYGGTMDLRLARCDPVVFLDLPRLAALRGEKNVVILTTPAAVREFLDAHTHG